VGSVQQQKKIYGWILGASKIPNTKNVKKTTLEKKKKPLKQEKEYQIIQDHPCQTNSQTHQVLSEALISLMLSRPSPLLSKARNLRGRLLWKEDLQETNGNPWWFTLFYQHNLEGCPPT